MDGLNRLDSAESAFFSRELQSTRARSRDVRFPTLMATQLIPVSSESGPGAETTRYEQYEEMGVARILANYSDDLARADVRGKEFITPIRSVGASYGYSIQDIRASQKAGKRLEQRRADAARRAIAQKINDIGFFGDDDYNLAGFFTNENVTRVSAPNDGTGSARTFASKDADKILRDMHNCVQSIVTLTNGIERANTLLLPEAQYGLIQSMRVSTVSDTTVLEFFLKTHQGITVIPVWQCKDAGIGVQGGVSAGEDIMVAYDRSPDKLEFDLPIEFEDFAPQLEGLEYEVPCHGRVGSVLYYYPLSCAITEGI